MRTTFARRLFLIAGVYGLLLIVPMLPAERLVDKLNPPAMVHPEYYYGFLWAALAWQLVYFAVASDPIRYRPMIPLAMVAKSSVALSVLALYGFGRASGLMAVVVLGDLAFAVLFGWAFVALGRSGSLD